MLHGPTTAVDAATEDAITDTPSWLARCDQVVHLPTSERTATS
ncbi:hypothetical protein ACIGZH_01335 [Streptomyces sp. NPDC058319]